MKIKYLNYVLCLIAIVGSFYIILTREQTLGIFLKDFSIVLTMPLLYIIELLFKVKIDEKIKLVYISFIFVAQFLGVTVELYNVIAYFDKITHALSGVLTAYGALLILSLVSHEPFKKKFFPIVWMITFSLAIAATWEMFEYTANIFFGGDAQRVALTGVNDTMQDIIVAFLGSILVSIAYAFYSKASLFNFDSSVKKCR